MATYTIYLEQEFTLGQYAGNNTAWSVVRGARADGVTASEYIQPIGSSAVSTGTYNDGTTKHSRQSHMLANTSAVPAGTDSNFNFCPYVIDALDTGHSLDLRVNAWPSQTSASWVPGNSITSKTPLIGTITTTNASGTGRLTIPFSSYTTVPRSSTFKFSLFDNYAKANTAPPTGGYQLFDFYSSPQQAGTSFDPYIQFDVLVPDTTPPTITSSSTKSVAENAVLSHTLTANEAVTWSIRSTAQNAASTDATHFEISGTTLRWAGNGTKDYEAPNDSNSNNTYVVVVRATDTASNVTDQTITVTVTDVNEDVTAPTITSSSTVSVAENSTLSHSLTANESVNWSIRTVGQNALSLDATQFEISGTTLRWVGNGSKNYESPTDSNSDNQYKVVVRATDLAGNPTDQTITVTVTDVFELPPWTPANLGTTAEIWFDASDAATVTSSGGAVSQIDDKSGNARHASQATAGLKPALSTINGLTALHFPGTERKLVHAAIIGAGADYTAFYVLQQDTFDQIIQYYHGGDVGAGDMGFYTHITEAPNSGWGAYKGGAFRTSNEYPPATGAPRLHVHNPANLYKNGTEVAYASGRTSTVTGGGLTTIGTRVDASYFIKGRMGEILIYTGVLSTADRQQIEGYLAWKWGMQANLPVGHPYKSAAPVLNTPPTITSGAAPSVNSDATLAHALTADTTVTWAIRTSGQDAASVDYAQFELSGSTLRWASNGTKSYYSPADTGSDNTYTVVVRATDTSTNLTTDQTITVTVLRVGGRAKVKVSGSYETCPVFVRIAGVWVEKPMYAQVSGAWQLTSD